MFSCSALKQGAGPGALVQVSSTGWGNCPVARLRRVGVSSELALDNRMERMWAKSPPPFHLKGGGLSDVAMAIDHFFHLHSTGHSHYFGVPNHDQVSMGTRLDRDLTACGLKGAERVLDAPLWTLVSETCLWWLS